VQQGHQRLFQSHKLFQYITLTTVDSTLLGITLPTEKQHITLRRNLDFPRIGNYRAILNDLKSV